MLVAHAGPATERERVRTGAIVGGSEIGQRLIQHGQYRVAIRHQDGPKLVTYLFDLGAWHSYPAHHDEIL